MPMSEALKDGDQVVVTAGPLLGHEGLIKTINRRKSTAFFGAQPVRPTRNHARWSCCAFKRAARHAESQKADCLAASGRYTEQGGSPTWDEVLEENVSEKTQYATDAPAGAALIAQAMDRREGDGRYKAMQSIMDWDRSPAYRAVKRAFDIVFSGAALVAIAIPSSFSPLPSARRARATPSTARSAWVRPTATAACPPSACGSSAPCTGTPTSDSPSSGEQKRDRWRHVQDEGGSPRHQDREVHPQALYRRVPTVSECVSGPDERRWARPPLPNEVAEYTEVRPAEASSEAVSRDSGRLRSETPPGSTAWSAVISKYIAKRGIVMDLKIVLLTVLEVFNGSDAY